MDRTVVYSSAMVAWLGALDFQERDFPELQIVRDDDGWCLIVRDRPGHWSRVAGPFSSRSEARKRLHQVIGLREEYVNGVRAWEAEQALIESNPSHPAMPGR